MSSELSVAKVLANLEAQMALHKEREAFHAQQEIFHREQRALHAAGLETVTQHFKAFQAASGGAAEIAARVEATQAAAVPPEAPREPWPARKRPQPGPLVAQIIKEMPAGEVFGPSKIAADMNRRFSRYLKNPMDTRLASSVLRRIATHGGIRLVKAGGPHHEAEYVRR